MSNLIWCSFVCEQQGCNRVTIVRKSPIFIYLFKVEQLCSSDQQKRLHLWRVLELHCNQGWTLKDFSTVCVNIYNDCCVYKTTTKTTKTELLFQLKRKQHKEKKLLIQRLWACWVSESLLMHKPANHLSSWDHQQTKHNPVRGTVGQAAPS